MKLVSMIRSGRAGVGLILSDGVLDLSQRMQAGSLREVLVRGLLPKVATFMGEAPDCGLDEVRYLPAVTDPAHIFCVGTNYRDHLKEVQDAGIARQEPTHPALFIRYPETMVGHQECLAMPAGSVQYDYEAELAVIIGVGGRFIRREDASHHIAGYACFNDGSVRDWQFHSQQVTAGKNFMASGALGPWMVTADEVPDCGNLSISCLLNGKVMQHSNTSQLIFDVPHLISYISQVLPLVPGDVIATGTPHGVGFSRKPPVVMAPDDVCEVEIERIGVLRNRVASADPP